MLQGKIANVLSWPAVIPLLQGNLDPMKSPVESPSPVCGEGRVRARHDAASRNEEQLSNSPVAQSVEQLAVNQLVGGSSPSRGARL
jgi:hypothetical protein